MLENFKDIMVIINHKQLQGKEENRKKSQKKIKMLKTIIE